MRVTFLIGNGFDVNLGLKTRYTDFYDSYIKSNENLPTTNCIKKFCDLIKSDYKTWGDFETAFAENISGDKKDVREILYDFTDKFYKYLSRECDKCSYDNPEITAKFKSFLIDGYKLLEKRDFQTIKQRYIDGENGDIRIDFINFNYTDTVGKLCDTYIKSNSNLKKLRTYRSSGNRGEYSEYIGDELHIHGSLQDYIIIGIDSVSQIQNEELRNNKSLAKYCVKDEINKDNGNPNIIKKYIELINGSDIIYAYGVSFGASDKSRWDIIQKWIRNSFLHKLIIYKYEAGFNKFSRAYNRKLLDTIEDAKNEYLKLLGFNEDEYEKYYDQIFVLDSVDVLQFKLIDDNSGNGGETAEIAVASGV